MQLQQAEDEKQGSLKNLEERRREIESLTKVTFDLKYIHPIRLNSFPHIIITSV